ncbi:MAG: hypothetical protein ACI8ZM_002986 [Crocinitomix sp.]
MESEKPKKSKILFKFYTMPIDTTPSTVATNALQAIPFSSLIGGPLDAAIKAQAMAAKTSWEFIQQVGLNTNVETGEKNAVNVTFYYNKNGNLTKLIVPLLTIVPIPYIAIDDVQINFKANISAVSSSTSENTTNTKMSAGIKGGAKLNYGIFSVHADFNANYSSKKDSKATEESKYSVEYTMDVSVHAGQSDMPAGLATVLNILQSSITDASEGGSFSFSPANPFVDLSTLDSEDFILNIKAEIKNSDGLFVKDKDVTLVLPTDLVTDYGLSAPTKVKTNNLGQVTIKLEGKAKLDSKPASGDLTFTVQEENNQESLTGTVSLEITGKLPKKDDSVPSSDTKKDKTPEGE